MATSMIQRLFTQGTKIVCVGRNYAAHAKELGNAVPKEPVIFLKPTSSYLENGGTIEIPHPLDSLHHEVELALVIGQKARDVPESLAMDYIGGYAVALDMTARELQASAKASGLPWTLAKGQDTFTPISSVIVRFLCLRSNGAKRETMVEEESPAATVNNSGGLKASVLDRKLIRREVPKTAGIVDCVQLRRHFFFNNRLSIRRKPKFVPELPKAMVHDPDNLELWLKVDGEIRQKGLTKDMIFKVPYLISYISSIMTLFEGDVILTGTPEGVGPVKIGQKITAGITGLSEVQFDVDRRVKPLT